jgi:hypothetical protein
MAYLLCRNRVRDYDTWKRIFDSHAAAHREVGLHRVHVWQDEDDPQEVYFVFEVDDVEAAKAFLDAPESEEAGLAAGVLDGEARFVDSLDEV